MAARRFKDDAAEEAWGIKCHSYLQQRIAAVRQWKQTHVEDMEPFPLTIDLDALVPDTDGVMADMTPDWMIVRSCAAYHSEKAKERRKELSRMRALAYA